MLYGVALGDALGAPHEFRKSVPLSEYTGRLQYQLSVFRRFQGGYIMGCVGQISDDTEMMIALADSIIDSSNDTRLIYNRHAAVEGYVDWANSACPFLGNNTRKLFVGISTAAGYERRMRKLCEQPMEEWTQSNGCLMRCAPIAALSNREVIAAVDCGITNPHPVCLDAVKSYVRAAHLLIEGHDVGSATESAYRQAETEVVKYAIESGRRRRPRTLDGPDRGWVAHGLYAAFVALHSPADTFAERLDEIIRLGGDTDTNAAIAGGLLGALYGAPAMMAEDRTGSNLRIVLECQTENGELVRPPEYSAGRLPDIAASLCR
jgi:ADP-ribosyl-[dinitrogen reductase] hydrolase